MKSAQLHLISITVGILAVTALTTHLCGSAAVQVKTQQFNKEATVDLYKLCETGGTVAQVEELIEKKADVNARHGEFSVTALHRACGKKFNSICEALIKANALVNAQSDFRCTPLHYAAEIDGRRDEEAAQVCGLLLKHGAVVDVQEENLRTALHLAAMYDFPRMATVLIKSGASLRIRNDGGRTPLMLAGLNGKKEMVQLLIRRQLLGLILPQGKTISAMRSSLAEIYFLLKSFEDSPLPVELRLKIFDEAFKLELICLLLDSRCCYLLPVETGKYLKMLREELPLLLSNEKKCIVIAQSLKEAFNLSRYQNMKELLNPVSMLAHIEELFIAPKQEEQKK